MAIKSQGELYTIFINALQAAAPDLTDVAVGSKVDSLGGVVSLAGAELGALLLDRFMKTFINQATGPTDTDAIDYLQTLIVDHFGDSFARPGATASAGIVKFTRPNANFGSVTIPIGTVVKTKPNANGEVQRFATEIAVSMGVGILTASVTANATVVGTGGNIAAGSITDIESSLLDSSIVTTNLAPFTGGAEIQDDDTYRQTFRNQIETLRGATLSAIEAKAKTVPGVARATAIESMVTVVEFDLTTLAPKAGASYFRIPVATLYVADANGSADQALIDNVVAAIKPVRAGGVKIQVKGATALVINWTAVLTFDPTGPNFAEFSANTTRIEDAMFQYLTELPIGTAFNKALADAAQLAIWGPAGTGDLVDKGFQTVVPTGNVVPTAIQKLVAGTMSAGD